MPPQRIPTEIGQAAVAAALADSRSELATAVRYLLQELADRAPGKTVEVRVPPYGAVQVISGPQHSRGTPPNVVETDPVGWLALATGTLGWDEAVASGVVTASGGRAHLSAHLPLYAAPSPSAAGELPRE